MSKQNLKLTPREQTYNTYVKLRDKHNMSDADVAKATGISKVTLSEWKTRAMPKLDKICLIAELFEVSLDVFAVKTTRRLQDKTKKR